MRRCSIRWIATPLIGAAIMTGAVAAQSCPPADGSNLDAKAPSVLHGTLRYHGGIRPWLGVVPDHPVCGAKEIELAFGNDGWCSAQRLSGCAVTVEGVISESPTAYYSADLNIFNPKVIPAPGCHLLPEEPDYLAMKIPPSVQAYRLTVFIDVAANKPLRGSVVDVGRPGQHLAPWRAYAEVALNGEEDMDLGCRDGFRMTSFSSVPPDASAPAPLFNGWARIYSSERGASSLTIECRRK